MSNIAIQVEGLSKLYRIGARQEKYRTMRDTLAGALSAPARRIGSALRSNGHRQTSKYETIWALKDVSFEVKRGEVVGVIGRNGAGKSTLLKILSRITEPTSGRAEIHGRVGSLLEVGTGFHHELTGRENIYLNGAILGMKRTEIERQFDAIVDFAEVEKFIDTPVKHYSSGMYLRLAFAVAAHLEPEILLVDEVLAVGDAQFQKKCLGKMGDVAREGRTVLFVSHNMAAIGGLCSRVLWVQRGELHDDGHPSDIISEYLAAAITRSALIEAESMEQAPGNEVVRIRSARVVPIGDADIQAVTISTPLLLEFEYWNLVPDLRLNISLHVINELGVIVFNTTSIHEPVWHGRGFPSGLFRSTCQIPANLLNDGTYSVHMLVVRDEGVVLYKYDDILIFDVLDDVALRGAWHGRWAGVVRPQLKWTTEAIEVEDQLPDTA